MIIHSIEANLFIHFFPFFSITKNIFGLVLYGGKISIYYSALENSIIDRIKKNIDNVEPMIEAYFKASPHQAQSSG